MAVISLFFRPHLVPGGDLSTIVEVGRLADAAGFHSIQFGEHLVMGERTDRYPYGPFAHAPATPWPDPFVTLGAIAAVTTRVRLSAGVVLAPLRPAIGLAKSVATLDVLSRGRVELGIGTGWQREEYDAAGIEWASREERFHEAIELCRLLWTGEVITYDGAFERLDRVRALPTPVQSRIPLLYGMKVSEAAVDRWARDGDGWCPVGLTPDAVQAGAERLRGAYRAAGRDPSELLVRIPLVPTRTSKGGVDVDATLAAGAPWVEAGATELTIAPDRPFADDSELRAFFDAFGARIP